MQHTEENALIKLCVFVNSEGWRNIDQEFLIIKMIQTVKPRLNIGQLQSFMLGPSLGKVCHGLNSISGFPKLSESALT